jgi:hypothetical protein
MTKEEAIAKYIDSIPPLSPGKQKIVECMAAYFRERLGRSLKEGDLAHRARPNKGDEDAEEPTT